MDYLYFFVTLQNFSKGFHAVRFPWKQNGMIHIYYYTSKHGSFTPSWKLPFISNYFKHPYLWWPYALKLILWVFDSVIKYLWQCSCHQYIPMIYPYVFSPFSSTSTLRSSLAWLSFASRRPYQSCDCSSLPHQRLSP